MPPTPRLEIDPPESEAEGCIFERVEPSTSEILAPVKMKIGLGNEKANNTSAFPLASRTLLVEKFDRTFIFDATRKSKRVWKRESKEGRSKRERRLETGWRF